MAETTGISWADVTWNPWIGCTPVSEGCQHCYARREMTRYGKDFSTVKRTSDKTFNLPLAKKRDGSWKIPDGSFVFVCSWSDFFHEDVLLRWHHDAIAIMEKRPGLTFLLLTKRVDMAARIHPSAAGNIWLGVTTENQARADERIPQLLSIDWPGKKFVSVEPMLGAIDLGSLQWALLNRRVRPDFPCGGASADRGIHAAQQNRHGALSVRTASGWLGVKPDEFAWCRGLDWVICGGESGPGARPMQLEWARDLRDQCQAANVPFHMKQLGGWPNKRAKLEDLPEDLRIRERP